ncbi:MAG: trypsin-like peptidase domain-containing protein [Planctomycetales bacterium]|nr:trypsin-like peptidase domain-containing protein [Planctomycetales bacterium]
MPVPRSSAPRGHWLMAALAILAVTAAGLYPLLAARQSIGTASPSDAEVLESAGRQLSDVTTRLMPSVVKIRCRKTTDQRGTVEETGSGIIVRHAPTRRTVVVTNAHVIAGQTPAELQVHLHDGRVTSPRQAWSDAASDVAVLSLDTPGLKPAQWGNSDRLQIGHFVLAAGSPFDLSHSVSLGIISAKGRRSLKLGSNAVINQDFLQTDAAINPGNSGGPLLDTRGRVVGINTAIATTSGTGSGVGFSIPSRLVQRIIDDLLRHGRVRRAYLGVVLDSNFTTEEARQLRLDRKRGARVVSVAKGTPAARASLQANDVVTEFQQKPVLDFDHLINLVSLQPIGSTVTLGVWRSGRRLQVRVSLSDRNVIDAAPDGR